MFKKFVGQLLAFILVCLTLAQLVVGNRWSILFCLSLVVMALYSRA